MAIRNLKKRERKNLLEDEFKFEEYKGVEVKKISGYKIPANKKFYFAGFNDFHTEDDFIFSLFGDKISNVDMINNLPDLLNLKIFNGAVYTFWDNKLKIISEKDINKFCLDYFKGLESESFMLKRYQKLLNQIEHLEIKSDIINFNNKEYDIYGNKIEIEEEYVSKVTFNCDLLSREEVEAQVDNNIMWNNYIEYVYGKEHLFNINKTFSTIMWTNKFIKKNMKVLFNVTDGSSGRTTIMNNLRELTLIKQSKAIWKNAEHNKFQGHAELKNATQNLIDDPVERKGYDFLITGDWLKDLTLEEFTFKGIGKDAMLEKNIIQNVVYLNKYKFDIDKTDYAQLRRIDWIEIRGTKDIRTWDMFENFVENFSYEWLLSYLYWWFIDNNELILSEENKFNVKLLEDDESKEMFVERLNDSPVLEFNWTNIKKVINEVIWKSKSWKNSKYVDFLESCKEELKEDFISKFYFSKNKKGVYNNITKSIITKKSLEEMKNNVEIETKFEDINKLKYTPKENIVKELKRIGAIEDTVFENHWKYILKDNVIVLDIEPIEKDKALSEATQSYILNMTKATTYHLTSGGIHIFAKCNDKESLKSVNEIENLGLKVEVKKRDISVKDNVFVGELTPYENIKILTKEKTVGFSSFTDKATSVKEAVALIRSWDNFAYGMNFDEFREYTDSGNRNNNLNIIFVRVFEISNQEIAEKITKRANETLNNPLNDKEINIICRKR